MRAWTIVDPEDYERFGHMRWCLDDKGYAMHSGGTRKERIRLKLHREVLGLQKGDGKEVDHINHDTLDNRKANLRVVDSSGNKHNQRLRKDNVTGIRGVSWDERRQRFKVQGKPTGEPNKFLGYFTDINEAIRRRIEWEATYQPLAPRRMRWEAVCVTFEAGRLPEGHVIPVQDGIEHAGVECPCGPVEKSEGVWHHQPPQNWWGYVLDSDDASAA